MRLNDALADGGLDAQVEAGPEPRDAANPDAPACASVEVPFRTLEPKADVIFGVDGSISMEDELVQVRARLSDFALQVYAAGTDLRVIVIAREASDPLGICIEAPFGSGDCAGDDSRPPAYVHVVSEKSGSSLVVNAIIEDDDAYAAYAPYLRDDADVHIVAISDTDSSRTAERWNELIPARDPHFEGYRFHAVVPLDTSCGSVGDRYADLANLSGGVISNLCTGDFQPVFSAIAKGVVDTSARCEWDLPTPPAGLQFEVGRVNVDVVDARGRRRLGYVPSREDCSRTQDKQGWYFDDPGAPTRMQACASTCAALSALAAGKVEIELGCETQPAPLF